MVTVFLRGGLGNQMFQYAAGLALAERNNARLIIDSVFLNDRLPRRNFTYRTFDLDIFTFAPKMTTLSRVSKKIPIPGVWLGMDFFLMKVGDVFSTHKIIEEKEEFVFDPKILEEKNDVILWGRWQSEKYFIDVSEKVRRAFTFRHELTGEAKALKEDIESSRSVSLHIRRGDYVAFKNIAQIMGDTDTIYYDRAIEYIAERVDHPKFFIFSDDIEWCKKNLTIPHDAVYVPSSSAGPKAAFHLELMSLCKHNIIANSTFSWWGGWLNENPKKIVVAPKIWYATRDPSLRMDIIPETWITLQGTS